MEVFLAGADELVVSTVCAHLELHSLRAIAQTLRPFRQLATWELQLRVVKRIGDKRHPAEETIRMLLMLRIMDEGALAKLTAPLVEVLLNLPLADFPVRACHHPCAGGRVTCSGSPLLCQRLTYPPRSGSQPLRMRNSLLEMLHTPSLAAFTPRLVAAAQSDEQDTAEIALLLIGRLPQDVLAPHAPALARQLGVCSSDDLVPILAKLDLCADAEVRAALCEALDSTDFELRVDALRALDTSHSGALAAYAPALLQVLMTFENLAAEDDYLDPSDWPGKKMREVAFKLLKRIAPSELAEHMEAVFAALSDSDRPMIVREMAMQAVRLLPPAAVAPHAQLVLQILREPDHERMGYNEGDAEIGMQMRETASDVLSNLELPVLAGLVPELLAGLEDEASCNDALRVLSQLPPAMLSDHVSSVLRTLFYRSEFYSEPETWQLILEQMDPSALAAHTDEVQEALLRTEERVRRSALQALKTFPLESIAAHATTLRGLLANPQPYSYYVQELALELLA
jgi:hypothetical protein